MREYWLPMAMAIPMQKPRNPQCPRRSPPGTSPKNRATSLVVQMEKKTNDASMSHESFSRRPTARTTMRIE